LGRIKQWRNGQWQDVSVKQYRNGQWVEVDVKQWRNGKWENLTSQQYTKTWDCIWTQTYRKSGTKRTDYRAEKLCQGQYVTEPWGIMRSLCGFDDGSRIRNELAGAKIIDVKLYLYAEHWYYYSGGTVYIGYHNHSSKPDTFSESKYRAVTATYSARGQGKWIDLPNSFAEGIRDGDYKGISIFANSTSMNYYGIFSGVHDGNNKPKLKITYEK